MTGYIVEKSLPADAEEHTAMESVDAILALRIAEANNGRLSSKSVVDIAGHIVRSASRVSYR